MELKAKYKCRLCGEVYKNGATTGPEVAWQHLVEMNAGICCTLPMAPLKTDIHHCSGGSLGLADFLGWEAKE